MEGKSIKDNSRDNHMTPKRLSRELEIETKHGTGVSLQRV